MTAHDGELKTGEATAKDLTISNKLLEEARRNGHDPEKVADEIYRTAREIVTSGPKGPAARKSTTWTLMFWLVSQTLLLLAALVVFWRENTLGITGESRLFLLVILAGMLGSTIAALVHVLEWCGQSGKVYLRDLPFLAALPALGAGIALIFYAAIRGGLLTATASGDGNTSDLVNPYGVVGISALVGLFLPGAMDRLKVVGSALFGEQEAPRGTRNE